MNRSVGIGLGLLAFILFCFVCIRHEARMVEHDVMSRTALALLDSGVPPTGLSVDGRDVMLAGPAGSAIVSNATRRLAQSVPGVRVVKVAFTGAVAAAVAQPDAKTVSAGKALSKTAVQAQRSITTLLQTKTVEFDIASAALTETGRETLKQIVPILKANPRLLCEIGGHTDNYGDRSFNLDLSKRRALATRDYLVSQGIEADRLSASGFGDSKPVASNQTRDGRRQNRRIEFLLKEKN